MIQCPKCGARLESALLCTSCGSLQEAASPDPFEVFGLERAFATDGAALEKRLLALSRGMHPDFYADADDGTRALAESNTADLNSAFEILSDDFRRADHLVRVLGGPTEEDEGQMPRAFLLEVLGWNEILEEAAGSGPGSAERAALDELEATLLRERKALMERIAERLEPLPEDGTAILSEIRRELNAIRYVDRALASARELRLEQAGSR